jgi:hypothetical protein
MAQRIEITDRPGISYGIVTFTNDSGECAEAEAKWLTIHSYDAKGKLIEVADGIVPQQPPFARRVRDHLGRASE